MTKRGKFLFFLLAVLAVSAVFYQSQIGDFVLSSKNRLADFKKNGFSEAVENIEASISAPPPLRAEKESPVSKLTLAGTIRWTNINRENNGLSPLTENKKLDEAAMAKAEDMLSGQYFEHISPEGKGPQDFVMEADYSYISIGENLALGNFASDKELLDAWMASPGHRENILKIGFTEIGVAVLRGKFEGKDTWIAVQEFGTPLSECRAVDTKLKKTIESNTKKISALSDSLEAQKDEISDMSRKDPTLSQKIDEYNAGVKEYNELVSETKSLIKTYNKQVSSYNACVKKITD